MTKAGLCEGCAVLVQEVVQPCAVRLVSPLCLPAPLSCSISPLPLPPPLFSVPPLSPPLPPSPHWALVRLVELLFFKSFLFIDFEVSSILKDFVEG